MRLFWAFFKWSKKAIGVQQFSSQRKLHSNQHILNDDPKIFFYQPSSKFRICQLVLFLYQNVYFFTNKTVR